VRAGRIVIDPLDEQDIQPASVDLHLDRRLLIFRNPAAPLVDLRADLSRLAEPVDMPADGAFIMEPGEFLLASTAERIEVPDDIVAQVKGKSSLARAGLMVASTAGYVDPGWKGRLTLEVGNASRLPVTLYAAMRICQISFMRLTAPAERPYGSPGLGSRYQGQERATPGRAHLDVGRRPGRSGGERATS